ncbi:hypothetical protein WN48_06705 [Eufriesea mexicana]|uniref:DUF4781 domain-containing protein n=1 Tax=Eufriesea mexicana TaxID=516756 RepID=A0A310SS83_9HYME|nr:hypothetical protein WN48_06705 [Eufriesea mexicana]
MLQIAKLQQQQYYEYFADWTKYKKHEYKYLKQNIGFALFGTPAEDKNADVTLNDENKINNEQDIIDSVYYSSNANKMIEGVYEKIYKFGEGRIEQGTIYYGLIYNITFRTKKSGKEKTKTNSKEKEKINVLSTPVFKINCGQFKICYIDNFGRLYDTWDDYKINNTLPKCKMVLPKDGFYQPDKGYEITKDTSTVWLEILDSPACSDVSDVCNALDTISNITGALGVGLTAASFFTPIVPIAAGATLCSGISGLWTVGRSTQKLKDRWSHKESISITNRSAFCAWLSITGCATGLIAASGNIVLNNFIRNGSKIGNVTKFSYNTLLISNLTVSGISTGYQGYCVYEKYVTEESVPLLDIAILTTHILFFSHTVLKTQFAGELIKSKQGKILDDYRASLRSKNLRKKFNRMIRKAAKNNDDTISKNAEVIRYISNKEHLQLNDNLNIHTQKRNTLLFKGGKMVICDIPLMDPFIFVETLIELDRNPEKQDSELYSVFSNSQEDNDRENVFCQLQNLLLHLLKNASLDHNEMEFDITKFANILHDVNMLGHSQKPSEMVLRADLHSQASALRESEFLISISKHCEPPLLHTTREWRRKILRFIDEPMNKAVYGSEWYLQLITSTFSICAPVN